MFTAVFLEIGKYYSATKFAAALQVALNTGPDDDTISVGSAGQDMAVTTECDIKFHVDLRHTHGAGVAWARSEFGKQWLGVTGGKRCC